MAPHFFSPTPCSRTGVLQERNNMPPDSLLLHAARAGLGCCRRREGGVLPGPSLLLAPCRWWAGGRLLIITVSRVAVLPDAPVCPAGLVLSICQCLNCCLQGRVTHLPAAAHQGQVHKEAVSTVCSRSLLCTLCYYKTHQQPACWPLAQAMAAAEHAGQINRENKA
jgi:hypothetical protein